jgi:hypothetical protein
MRMHRQQLQELVHLYEREDASSHASFETKLREWRQWIRKGYVLEVPGNPPRPFDTTEAFDQWALVRFPPRKTS